MTVWIVVGMDEHDYPVIIGAFDNKAAADEVYARHEDAYKYIEIVEEKVES